MPSRHEHADAEQDDDSNADPDGWRIQIERGHRQPDDQDDEADEVRGERGHAERSSKISAQPRTRHSFWFASQSNLGRTRHQQSGSSPDAESFRVATARQPDVEMVALDAATRVVEEEASVILSADVQLHIAGHRKELRIRGHDSRAHVSSAASGSRQTVRSERDRDGIAVSRSARQTIPALLCPAHHGAVDHQRRRDDDRWVSKGPVRTTAARDDDHHQSEHPRASHSSAVLTSLSATGIAQPDWRPAMLPIRSGSAYSTRPDRAFLSDLVALRTAPRSSGGRAVGRPRDLSAD